MNSRFATIVATLILAAGSTAAFAADPKMGFFVSSVGIGDGANLGGLAGADAHCGKLAASAGSTGRTWRAYLSTQVKGKRGVSARDRIGTGPWYNATGELIASDLDQLHLNPNIVKRTALDENGNRVNGRGDKPNRHDILTGSTAVRFNFVDVVHGIDSTGVQAFRDDLDTDEDQRHASSQYCIPRCVEASSLGCVRQPGQ